MSTPNLTWVDEAVCQSVDPELFFPPGEPGEQLYERQAAAAKRVCAGCPMRGACLSWAIEHLPYGIAGGVDAHTRRVLRQGRKGRAA